VNFLRIEQNGPAVREHHRPGKPFERKGFPMGTMITAGGYTFNFGGVTNEYRWLTMDVVDELQGKFADALASTFFWAETNGGRQFRSTLPKGSENRIAKIRFSQHPHVYVRFSRQTTTILVGSKKWPCTAANIEKAKRAGIGKQTRAKELMAAAAGRRIKAPRLRPPKPKRRCVDCSKWLMEKWVRRCVSCATQNRAKKRADAVDYQRQWRIENREKYLAQKKRRHKRVRADPEKRIWEALRKNINNGIRAAAFGIPCKYKIADIGCDWQDFLCYLEKQFSAGMSWGNYGRGKNKWHVDHIFPVSKIDVSDPIQLKAVNHYKNLQPLWQNENLSKKDSVTPADVFHFSALCREIARKGCKRAG